MARAMSSLPVPLSPTMQTLALPAATFSIFAKTSRIWGDWPMMSDTTALPRWPTGEAVFTPGSKRPNARSSTWVRASTPRGRSRHWTPGRDASCSSPCTVPPKNTRVMPGAPLRWRATSRGVIAGERLITRRSAGPWLASTISSSCAEQTKTPSAPRAARKWWMLGEMSSVSSSTSVFIGSSSSALGGRVHHAVAALAHRLVDVRLGAREQDFVVVSVAGEGDAPHAEGDLPRTAGLGQERDLLDVSAYALGHAGGVPALGMEQ